MSLREKVKISVVDDMSTSRSLIVQALETFGIKDIRAYSSARQAYNCLRTDPCHLIVSDYNMPDIDGLSFLTMIRADPKLKSAGFILVTGRADPNILAKGKNLGLNNYIGKPFSLADFKLCIEAVVGRL